MGAERDLADLAVGDFPGVLHGARDPRERVLPRLVVLARVPLGRFRRVAGEYVGRGRPLEGDVVGFGVHLIRWVT